MLRAAKEESTPRKGKRRSDLAYTPEDLMHFTESLGAYAREVLPPLRPTRRSLSSRATTSVSGSTYVQTLPSRWRPQDPYSEIPSKPAHMSRETDSRPNRGTPSGISTSSSSCSSGLQVITEPDIVSSVSSASREGVEPKSALARQDEQTRPEPHAPTFFEIRDTISREYINDPEGNILSHPKVKHPAKEPLVPKTRQIGRHKMTLSATEFRINNHSYVVTKYHVADALFETLLQHPDKFDGLVAVLDAGEERKKWDGIPGWVADSRQIMRQA
jgi:hypothetical protein